MKKLITLCLLLNIVCTINAQKTFTSKAEAIQFFKETMLANFIKTPVIGKYDGVKFNDYNWYYDYELTDTYLKIIRKSGDEPDDWFQKNHTWAEMKFTDITRVLISEKSKDFKKVTGLTFKSRYANFQSGYGRTLQKKTTTSSSYSETFPFINAMDKEIVISLINAINTIAKENKVAAKVKTNGQDR